MNKDDKLSDVIGTLHKLTTAIFSDAIQRKLILDNLTEAVFTIDIDLNITSLNKAAQNLTGITEKETLGRKCTDVFVSPTEDQFCIIGQVLSEKHPLTKQTRHLQIGDRLLPVMVSASPLTDNSGDIVGGVQSFQEIQEIFQRQLVLDSAFDGVFTVDLDLNITLFNKAAEKMTGFKQDQVLGKPFADILYPHNERQDTPLTTPLTMALQTGRPVVEECIYINTAGGDILPVSVRAAPLIDARGALIGGVKNFRDNTDRIQTNLILDHVVDGVFTTDKNGKMTSFNKAAAKITGYTQKEVLGRSCHDMFASERCNTRMEQFSKFGSSAEPWINKHFYLQVKDERIVPVSMSSVPIVDLRGNLLGTVQTFRDVTNELQYGFILDSVTDGVFTVDHNLIITSFNKALENITGYTVDEALGQKCSDTFCSELCGTDNCPMNLAMGLQPRSSGHNVIIRSKDGAAIPVNVIATALTDDDGNVIGGVETIRDLTEITELRRKLSHDGSTQGILTRSPKMQRILSVLPEFAKSDATILVLGESGTGKELIAQSIHTESNRKKRPFIAVNSGALPDTLLESELFGYKAGAFTDARKDKKGRFAAAEKGTLFLDEIGDISAAMQVKLLRVIQSKTYEPLGSNTPIKTDVRIIAATNKNLEEMVAQGTFREDLYYRLNVVKIDLPPLRDRIEDVPLLVEHFIARFNEQRNRHVEGISEEVLSLLIRHEYPGNIRELENIIEYAFILCHDGLILPQHLPEWLISRHEDEGGTAGPLTLKEMERRTIIETLRRNDNRKMKTCRELGISKDTLRRKIAAYDIKIS